MKPRQADVLHNALHFLGNSILDRDLTPRCRRVGLFTTHFGRLQFYGISRRRVSKSSLKV